MQLFAIAAMLIAALGVTFALQNTVPVTVTFLSWSFDSSLAMVLLLTLAMGGFIVALVSTPWALSKQWTAARQSRRIAELENTCSIREKTINDLENHLTQGQSVPAGEEPSYVGLKEILAGEGHGERSHHG